MFLVVIPTFFHSWPLSQINWRVGDHQLRSLFMSVSELEVCFGRGMSHVTRMQATYPYKFLRSNVSNSAYSTIFILGYGGGAVSGDRQELRIIVNENAVLILRTQGSMKIFKCVDGKYSSQKIVAHLSNGSLLAFLPDPTTCFRGSKYDQHQIFNLEEEARSAMCCPTD